MDRRDKVMGEGNYVEGSVVEKVMKGKAGGDWKRKLNAKSTQAD